MSILINNLPIDTRDIEEGVDRKQLNLLKQRFLAINQIRFERSCQSLTDRQKDFLQLLPLLFHVNHPLLPGYISHQVPAGVMHYHPQKHEILLAKTWARSFHYQKELSVKNTNIDAIFIMGSPGTIAQNEISDLDLWICYRPDLHDEQRQQLQYKAELIADWALKTLHLTMHAFLMQSNAFKEAKDLAFNSEASGTAQYYLLLDEFYRTALWLAGKVPLWWFIPAEREDDYEYYAQTLLQKRFIKTNDVIDFGGIAKIPAEEFLGAGIWQLYKAIESPYKSVLKLLLLEIYATQKTPALGQPLALAFKQAVYAGITQADQLDPYVFIYRRIEKYLESQSSNLRLELIRHCFYFKVNRALSKDLRVSWQTELLRSLIEEWGWDKHKLQQLDHRSQWKAPRVIEEHNLLVSELSHSYQLLNDLHKRLGIDAAISREELTILGRKLYAAFERRAGKVNIINPGISSNLLEDELWFVQSRQGDLTSWTVYASEKKSRSISTDDAIKHAPQLMELIFWCYLNRLISPSTRLNFQAEKFEQSFTQHQLLSCIKNWLPDSSQDIEHQAFHAPAKITHFLIIANFGHEPHTELQKKGLHLISNQNDALGYSGFRENLVHCLDMIYINSWGELSCRRFERDALVQAMQFYLQSINKQGLFFPKINFNCFTSGKGNLIAQRLDILWKHLHNCFFNNTSQQPRFLFEMGDEYILMDSPSHQDTSVFRCNTQTALFKKLSTPNAYPGKLTIDPFALRNTALPTIFQHYSPHAVQLFYQVTQQQALIYLLDDRGALMQHSTLYLNQATLLRPICYFLQTLIAKLAFNIDEADKAPLLVIHEIVRKNNLVNSTLADWQLETRKVDAETAHLPLFSIKVIVEFDENHREHYLVYSNQQEFSSYILGEKVFEKVAAYIKAHRKNTDIYPCYITDLDISHYHRPHNGLQLMEFWKMKIFLEEKINAVFDAL